ncbi:prolyl oligopeptidase family serine peptidase [Actinomycetota bacterium Odt1-20B]
MSSWLATQDTRFAAAVPIAPVIDWSSQSFTSNIAAWGNRFLDADPQQHATRAHTRSPVLHASKARTPCPVVAGALDNCTPPGQAQQFHQALRARGAVDAGDLPPRGPRGACVPGADQLPDAGARPLRAPHARDSGNFLGIWGRLIGAPLSDPTGGITTMNAITTTPPRPLDVTALFPQLVPLACRATRLHPRPGPRQCTTAPPAGPLLWPRRRAVDVLRRAARQPCDAVVHAPGDIRLYPRIWAASDERLRLAPPKHPRGPPRTPEDPRGTGDLGAVQRGSSVVRRPGPSPDRRPALHPRRPLPVPTRRGPPPGPVVPLRPRGGRPPRTALFWRPSTTVTDVLDAPPEPPVVQSASYLPEPCPFAPEQVTEFPNPAELDEELRGQLEDRRLDPLEPIDPVDRSCSECGTDESRTSPSPHRNGTAAARPGSPRRNEPPPPPRLPRAPVTATSP